MKKIFNVLFATAALLAASQTVGAQGQWSIIRQVQDPNYPGQAGHIITFPRDPGHTIDSEKHFGYSKTVASPFSDGTYWIKLESFATGTADIVDKPSDIVLVLDVSGSMRDVYSTADQKMRPFGTAECNSAGISWSHLGNNDTRPQGGKWNASYYKYNGEYYKVQRLREGPSNAYKYYAYFEEVEGDESTRHWLSGLDVLDTKPAGVTGSGTAIYWGTLWRVKYKSKLDELKEAVTEFIRIIQENDMYVTDPETGEPMVDPVTGEKVKRTDDQGQVTTLGNRISIVKFAGAGYYSEDHLAEGNHFGCGGSNTSNYTEVVKNLTYVDAAGVTALNAAVDELIEATITAADYAVPLANEVLNQPTCKNRDSNKTVVFFTDGEPNHNNGFDGNVANAAINASYTTKNTHKATVFTVGLFATESANVKAYMNRLSSNYLDATARDNGTQTSSKYYIRVNGNLKEVFANIAKQAGGSGAGLSAASSNVDIVSHSFKFPDDVTASNIGTKVKIFTAKLNHINNLGEENEEYVFDEEILAGHSNDKYKVYDAQGNVTGEYFVDEHSGTGAHGQGLKAEMITTPDGNKGVKVTNYDYANNWCGPIKNQAHQVTGYQGHKIVILIPVQMNPDAVGGPNVETNGEGSGIFINGDESYLEFVSPKVSLPVNIYIEKEGLEGVESARFLIERAVLPASGDVSEIADEAWEYVTTVFVTNGEHAKRTSANNPYVKVRGLASNKSETEGYIYRITEEPWSWSYTPDTDPQYTDTSHIENPFTFENTKKDRIDVLIRHAESKVTNVFKPKSTSSTEGEVKIDDSKTND